MKNIFDVFGRVREIKAPSPATQRIESIVVSEDSVAGSERFDKRGIGAANAVAVEIGAGVETQGTNDVAFKYGTEKNDLGPGGFEHRLLVGSSFGTIFSQDNEGHTALAKRIGANDFENVVFGLGSGDQEVIVFSLEVEFLNEFHGSGSDEVRAIWNHSDFLFRSMAGEMTRDFGMIGNQMIGDASACPFVKPKPDTRGQRPLFALPVDAVHIHKIGQRACTITGIEQAGVVAQRQNDAIFTERMLDRFPIEMHGSNGTTACGNKNAPYSIPNILTLLFVFFGLAIDSDIVIAGAEKERKILCKGFEPAMPRRYPTGSEYQNVHAVRSWPLPESYLKRRDEDYMDARFAVISVKPRRHQAA